MLKIKINLYLDDLRDIPEGYVGARTVDEALFYLKSDKYVVEKLSLDHDLGEKDGELLPDGQVLVKAIGEYGLYAKEIYIHTHNPVGREAMYSSLLSFKRHDLIDESIKIYNYSITDDKYTR